MGTETEIVAWTRWMRAAGRRSTTIGLRTYHVRRVLGHVTSPPWELTTDDLIEYLAAQNWEAETRRSCRTSLIQFYAWGMTTARCTRNPAAGLPPVKAPRGRPRPTPEDIYLEARSNADDRVRLMLDLGAVLGLRCCEIAGARREDLLPDLVGYSLTVHGKGGHERLVPVLDPLLSLLLAQPPGWLFPSSSRPGQPITPNHVGKLVSRSLPDGWTCHTLRHRCATVAYAADRDIRAVQELLGHVSPETTARYTQVPTGAIRAAVAATGAAAA